MGNPVVVVRENKTRLVVAREGKKGDVGVPGPGLEDGGTTGQVLRKASNLDQDTEWHTLTAGDVGADSSGAASAAQAAAMPSAQFLWYTTKGLLLMMLLLKYDRQELPRHEHAANSRNLVLHVQDY